MSCNPGGEAPGDFESCLHASMLCRVGVLVSKESELSEVEHSKVPQNSKLRLPPGPSGDLSLVIWKRSACCDSGVGEEVGGRGGGWEGKCVGPSALAQSSGQAGECPALPVVRDLIRRSGGPGGHTPRPASRPADVLADEGAARRAGEVSRVSPSSTGCGHREEAAGPQQGSETCPISPTRGHCLGPETG